MSEPSEAVVERARSLAVSMHEGCGHTRSSGEPYWRHPERVVGTLRACGQGPAVLAAAWLHDVPEDCPPDEAGCRELLARIGREFGAEVGAIVGEVTNYFAPGQLATMEEKQARLCEHARHMSVSAKWIKLADRWDNISGMQGWAESKRRRYAQATLALLEALRPWPEGAEELAGRIEARARTVGAEPE